ncbi:hypothetical protein KKF32_04980 [Patescibacteria group bacterium]|nr:hypothetical protein [Patescibacteria group bacterium]
MKKIIIYTLLTSVIFLGGCVVSVKTTPHQTDGGLFISFDKGENWEQRTIIYQLGQAAENFNTVDVVSMAVDPGDNKAIYVGTVSKGIYYTYNGSEGWHQTLLGNGKINDIAVSSQETCTIYAAIGNRVYKSSDCNRHWDYKLIDTRVDPNNIINTLAVDPFNTSIIYAGTSGEALYRSDDAGNSWRAIKFFNNKVIKILVNSKKPGVIYVATDNDGIYKTENEGIDWRQLITSELEESFKNILTYRDLIIDPTQEDGIIYASSYGIFRSVDGGNNWQELKLLTPPNTATIYSLAVNPFDEKEIYYGVSSTLYRSQDGGENWITKNLPTSRAPIFLFVDSVNPNIVYIGAKKVK